MDTKERKEERKAWREMESCLRNMRRELDRMNREIGCLDSTLSGVYMHFDNLELGVAEQVNS